MEQEREMERRVPLSSAVCCVHGSFQIEPDSLCSALLLARVQLAIWDITHASIRVTGHVPLLWYCCCFLGEGAVFLC